MTFTWCHLQLVSWDTGTVWNNQSFFFRKIQKLRRRKPINIWCLDRCSVKYNSPQVKLLSMLLIIRLKKKNIVCPFSFPSPLHFLFYYCFLKNKRSCPPYVCMCAFFTHKKKKGRMKAGDKKDKLSYYPAEWRVRKLWRQWRYNSLVTKERNANDLVFHSVTVPQSSYQLLCTLL